VIGGNSGSSASTFFDQIQLPSNQDMNSITWPRISLVIAFVSGVLLTFGYKDLYPELEARYLARKRQRRFSAENDPTKHEAVLLDDIESDIKTDEDGTRLVRDVKEGIEGCIGNTPLIRIVSVVAL